MAAGVGNVTLPDEEKRNLWSLGECEFRCGAYVVVKSNDRKFEIRHMMDVGPETEEGDLLLLQFHGNRREALLNVPRTFTIGFLSITFGNRFVPWKAGA